MVHQLDQDDAASQKAKDDRKEHRLKYATALIGLLGAIVTVLGTVAGVFIKKTNTANDRVDTSQQQIDALRNENDTLQKQVDEFRRHASEGAGTSQGASPSPTASDPVTPDATEPGVRHAGPLLLVAGNAADLDASSDNPRWEGVGTDIELNGSGVVGGPYNSRWATTADTANYNTCFNHQGYKITDFEYTLLQRTKTLCMITTDGRIAALKVQSVTKDELKFDVKVYLKSNE